MKAPIVSIDQAIELLQNGGIGIMPTDTVYGLVAQATNNLAVERLYRVKDRERKPGTLIAASPKQLKVLGVKQSDLDKVSKWWPGALSAVLDIDREYLHQGLGDVAMRVVADPAISTILKQTGPLMTSSANRPSEPGSVNIQEAINYFGDKVDFYVDGGNLSGKSPSTIVKLAANGSITVLRQGAVDISAPTDVVKYRQ